MQRYLIDHAIKNVWGNPFQDQQYMLSAKRITPFNGALNSFTLMNRQINLPVKGKRYHVFQVGQLSPTLLGFFSNMPNWVTESWINLASSMEKNKLMVTLYTRDGNIIPRFQSYLLFSNEKSLVYIVEDNPKLKVDLKTEKVYLRVYSNAYFGKNDGDKANDKIVCKGRPIVTNEDILTVQREVAALRSKPGYVTCFANGFIVNDISLLTVKVGDVVEYVYDSSIKRVVTFTIKDLNSFTSERDGKAKFLLHYLGEGDKTIDFEDDIDTFILAPTNFNHYKGYFYHHNTIESLRMVTHRDYSIVADYVYYIANKLAEDVSSTPLDPETFKIQLVIRKSGTNRELIYDNSRIFELYQLSDDKIVQAMLGVNSTLPMWQASNLENNDYTRLMQVPFRKDITMELIQKAYGYNSISKIIADTPQKTRLISGRQTADLPLALAENCTVYEYDKDGYLIGWHPYTGGATYKAADNKTRLIEAIVGQGTDTPEMSFGTNNIKMPVVSSCRVYACFLDNGVPNEDWRDVTGSTEYKIVDGYLVSTNEQLQQFFMIRKDKTFLAYDIPLTCVNGNLFFTLAEYEDRGLGRGKQRYALPVPMGDIDIFLNGRSLIRGIDYTVVKNKVFIVNKKYMNQPGETAPQHVHVRATGFCSKELEWDQEEDVGYIKFGYLSNNNQYDIRDDKVLRITVDGKTFHRDDLVFSENHDGVTVADPKNGLPYQVKDIVVPLKELVGETTYTLRAKSQAIDEAVSKYMTIKNPEPDRGNLNVISTKHRVVSPFVCRILDALRSGEITEAQIAAATNDSAVIMLCQPFEDVLAFDPVNEELNYDYNYVQVEPHHNSTVIDIPLAQYKILAKAVQLYCHGVVQLSPFFTISN